ncbi:glycosyltransferase [Paracoccus benzoatiresistens]|uniref:Glycosyltransferase n=1 Tax=Paracoccus benzoatiresistens TaxID=2997341 RepID=A0ABT4J9D3_9RHOB|nr:glycosyltransferase [Paracoccus sp. EF6]MCZ0963692.1 glycosyltransferase [Paracoccus sp. EF6]
MRIIGYVDPTHGGPVEGIKRSSERMQEQGHETEIVSSDHANAPYIANFPMTVHACGRSDKQGWGYSPDIEQWIVREGHRFDAAVIHGIWHWSAVGGYRGLKRAGVPYVVFAHGMLDPWFRKVKPVKHWIKQVYWWMWLGRVMRDAQWVLFTTEEEMRLAQGAFWGYPFKSRTVAYGAPDIPNRDNQQRNAFAEALPDVVGKPYLLFLSRIHAKKGCDLLVEAFAAEAQRWPGLQLVVAGPDSDGLVDGLRERASKLGVGDRIHWPGMLSGDAKYGAFRGAEAFILPSHQENFGIVVAEAMAASLPVMTTYKVNTWREVVAGKAGFVESDTYDGIRKLLANWLALPAEQRKAMRATARATYERHFMIGKASDALAEVLEEAIAIRNSVRL